MESTTKQAIGFIGLGIMGGAMARNLLRAGYEVHVFNRSDSKVRELAAEGAVAASSPRELSERAETVLSCVTDGKALEALLFGEEGLFTGQRHPRLHIDLSTIPPSLARSLAARLATYGASFVDAPVTGGDVGARNATLTIMLGGSDADAAAATLVLAAVGKKILHMGPVGSGQLAKCVNQLVVAVTVAAMTEGLCFAEKAGLPLPRVLEAISSGAAGSWALENYAPRILRGDLKPGFYARDMLKDLAIALGEAGVLMQPVPVSAVVKELYTAMCASGCGALGNHGLIQLYRSWEASARV